ncbi:MAG: SDR family oxidoreductase [Planctomycetes bacterium]|nr:SDR family oxidoreductase [Planctomycetota bacterium]MBL7039149.1 SDR family oxidoreductase [Pirellulaceae bacterium]
MSYYTLLTGATGLVGRYLIRDLLSRGHRLAVLVRSSRKETARERTEAILQMWEALSGQPMPRPICLEGDVNQPGLGLKPSDREWVAENCDRIIHNAAVLTFHGKDRNDDPWRTNLGGTRNTLDACRELGILDLHYVSTAYVCGTRPGVIREDELDCGQDFRNDYEHSKFLAEKMVRDADFLEQLTVYRPVVIAGDSESGYTNTYHGLYTYLRLISVLVWNQEPQPDGRRYTPVRLNMTGEEKRNIVPVDWTSAVLCRLFETPEAHGGTYHLSPKDPLTPREIIEAGYKYFNSYGVEFFGPEANAAGSAGDMDKAFQENREIYQSYEATDPTFDTTNTDRFAGDLPCPKIDEAMLHRFWKYGEEDRWGKRRPPKAVVPFWVDDSLDNTATQTQTQTSDGLSGTDRLDMPLTIGLDILGPGGGQWQVLLRGASLGDVEKGLPSEAAAILRISVDNWQRLPEQSRDEAIRQMSENLEVLNGVAAETLAGWLHGTLVSRAPKIRQVRACEASCRNKDNGARTKSPSRSKATSQG